MPGQWGYLPVGELSPAQVDQLVLDLVVAYQLCPPGQLPTPPDRRSVGWSVAALGIRPDGKVINDAHARVRATAALVAQHDQH